MHEEMGGGKEEKMSVLVKGMEMPKTCNDCPLLDWDLSYIKCGVVNRKFKVDEEHFRESRVYDCPLIEIPPHGRLIDADALDKTIEFIGEAEAQIYGSQNWRFAMKCRQALENAPTIIEAEPCNDLAKPNNASTIIGAEGRE